jgi:hypothetical protein
VIGSPEVDKVLRMALCPTLRSNGFAKVGPRKAWGWHDRWVWVFQIRAVGRYFSEVTGWPPMSVCVWLGAFFDYQPSSQRIKRDAKGRLIPDEVICPNRSHLTCSLDQARFTKGLRNPAERGRNDIWWISPDGSNLSEVIMDIRQQFLAQGLVWYQQSMRL